MKQVQRYKILPFWNLILVKEVVTAQKCEEKILRTFKIYFTMSLFDLCGTITFISLEEFQWADWMVIFQDIFLFPLLYLQQYSKARSSLYSVILFLIVSPWHLLKGGESYMDITHYVQICIANRFDRHERSLVNFTHYLLFRFPYNSWCLKSVLDY